MWKRIARAAADRLDHRHVRGHHAGRRRDGLRRSSPTTRRGAGRATRRSSATARRKALPRPKRPTIPSRARRSFRCSASAFPSSNSVGGPARRLPDARPDSRADAVRASIRTSSTASSPACSSANIAMVILGYLIMAPCLWLVNRPKPYLMAFIYALVVSGVYAIEASLFHVGVALGFGVLGYAMRYFSVPFLPMVLGVVLGFMVESNYRRALVLSSGDHMTFLRDPISAGLLALRARLHRRLAAAEHGRAAAEEPSRTRLHDGAQSSVRSVLLISFGGPQGPKDIRPFLENVLRGRRVAPQRMEEVAHHYELFGGVSPITALTRAAGGRACARGSRRQGIRCRSTWGCATGTRSSGTRCTRCTRTARGTRSASSPRLITPTRAASSTGTTSSPRATALRHEHRRRHRRHLRGQLVRSPALHRGQRRARARGGGSAARRRARRARGSCSPRTASRCRWPSSRAIASSSRSRRAWWRRRPASRTGPSCIQSRSGRPEDPWLEPDVCDYLRRERAAGLAGRRAVPDRVRLPITSRCCTTSIARPQRSAATSACR